MDLYDVLDRIVNLLRERKRLTYRLLQRQFDLDEETLADLKDELIHAQRVAIDEDGTVLVWHDDAEGAAGAAQPVARPAIAQPNQPATSPPSPTPPTNSPMHFSWPLPRSMTRPYSGN